MIRLLLLTRSFSVKAILANTTITQTASCIPVWPPFAPSPQRSHLCGTLQLPRDENQCVQLNGWLAHYRRASKNIYFLVMRDYTGLVQCIVNTKTLNLEESRQSLTFDDLSVESVLHVKGRVQSRKEINPEMATGSLEVNVESLYVLNASQSPLPLEVTPETSSQVSQAALQVRPNELLRLQYRYLEMRGSFLQTQLRLRSKVMKWIRQYLEEQLFLEVETPLLFKSTPEGAREFLVPTREPGQFFALPQSPQQFKQLLMAGGCDRYYQLAKCFRDEGQRPDRQPEFTQLDLECSYATVDGLISLMEPLMALLWRNCKSIEIQTPFERVSYKEAMNKYGSDKPDRRFEYLIEQELQENDTIIDILKLNGNWSNEQVAQMRELAQQPHIETLSFEIKHFDQGDVECRILRPAFIHTGSTLAGRLRLAAQKLNPLPLKKNLDFLWVVDHPLFAPIQEDTEMTESQGQRFVSVHHPFTAPHPDDEEMLVHTPHLCRAQHYDLVVNGIELGGGSIRIHSAELQRHFMKNLMQLTDEQLKKFDHLLNALASGCPPHGGLALGLDRLVLLLSDEAMTLRDVIAFPKTADGRDVMCDAPGPVDDATLKLYGLKSKN